MPVVLEGAADDHAALLVAVDVPAAPRGFKRLLAEARSAAALDQAVTEALRSIAAQNAAAWFHHGGCQGTAVMEPL